MNSSTSNNSLSVDSNATVLPLPPTLSDENAVAFVNHASQVSGVGRLIIDFTTLRWATPFGTLVIAVGIKDLIEARKRKALATRIVPDPELSANSAISYLREFGFFNYLSRPRERYRANLIGGKQYLPISRLSRDSIESENRIIQEGIDKYSDRLAAILFADCPGSALMTSYCLREIVRNAFEHGQVDECLFMAQRWQNKEAEIAVADAGCGIHATINPVHQTLDARASVKLSLLPGISGINANPDMGFYSNSGFGLYVISQLGARYGEFSIQSSGELLTKRNDEQRWLSAASQGTFIKLKINTSDGEYFPNILGQIAKEGEKIAGLIPGAEKTASKATKSASKPS